MDIKITEDLWVSRTLPEGILERWTVLNGAAVIAGERIAEVLIEDALHEVMAPMSGRLTIAVAANDIIEPGTIIGQICPKQ